MLNFIKTFGLTIINKFNQSKPANSLILEDLNVRICVNLIFKNLFCENLNVNQLNIFTISN